jgi:hypothetical protein
MISTRAAWAKHPMVSKKPSVGLTGNHRREMNQTEARYEREIIQPAFYKGEVIWYRYEAITLVLGDNTRYTPDFMVQLGNGTLEVHEVKGGFVREDAWIKLKWCAEHFPVKVIMAQWTKKTGWKMKVV